MANKWGVEFDTTLTVRDNDGVRDFDYSPYLEFETESNDQIAVAAEAWSKANVSSYGVTFDMIKTNQIEHGAVKSISIQWIEAR